MIDTLWNARNNTALWLALVGLMSACGGAPASGPAETNWDVDICERCAMTVSSRRFATQVRTADDHRHHLFDDPGCALLWLAEKTGGNLTGAGEEANRAEIWMRDERGEQWIDGWNARYQSGLQTPMGYGFASVEDGNSDAVGLQEAWRQIVERDRERREGSGG